MPDPSNGRRLDTWNEIATFLGVTVRTAMRWERDRRLPVHRVPGGEKQRVFAYPSELTVWLNSNCETAVKSSPATEPTTSSDQDAARVAPEPAAFTAATVTGTEVSPTLDPVAEDTSATDVAVADADPQRPVARRWLSMPLLSFLVLLLVSLGRWEDRRNRDAAFLEVTGAHSLTNDGLRKQSLVTDGLNLYYGVVKDGRMQLATVPVAGGTPRMVSELAPNAEPADLSADGSYLLALRYDGKEHERELWNVATASGTVRRVGTILCHSAAWRNAHTLAFAVGQEIILASDTGEVLRRLATLNGSAWELHWSADGTRLRYLLRDPINGEGTAWEARADAEGNLTRQEMVSVASNPVWQISNENRDGRYFLVAGSEFTHRSLWLAGAGSGLRGPMQPYVAGAKDTKEIAFHPQGVGLYALMNRGDATEMYRFENNHAFSPFLPGLSVTFLDFSPDGKRVAYVTTGWGTTLWSSNADGSNAIELDPDLHDVELPRWSPDGSRIACMLKKPGRPWRIYIVPSGGGRAEEAVAGNDGQGAPTWSPDGRRIAYGGIECEEVGTCAIHILDLAAGRVDNLPGSEGLGTARWSPDGKYIAALHRNRHALYVYDLAHRTWSMRADYMSGNDLAWSRDSRYIYSIRDTGTNPAILRVPVRGQGAPEVMIDLAPLNELPGYMDTFFCIAPDGAIIALRYRPAMDLYAFDLSAKRRGWWRW